MSFDATDLEVARREHAAEMGETSKGDRAWFAWALRVELRLEKLGWDEKFTGGARAGQSRGLDGDESENGYSLDYAYEAWEDGLSVDAYMSKVERARQELGL